MKSDRTWVIAAHEWRTTVMRREFLLVTFGLPLLFLVIAGIGGLAGALAVAKSLNSPGMDKPIGVSDPNHVLNPAAFAKPIDRNTYQYVPNLQQAQQEVVSGHLRALLVIAPDYVETGNYTVYQKPAGDLFSDAGKAASSSYTAALRAGLIWGKASPAVVTRLVAPSNGESTLEWDAKHHQFRKPDLIQEGAKFVVPYLFSFLLMMAIFLGTGYLLNGIVEEKENRVMEVLLSSVTHQQILRGKLLGLGGAGLTQMGVWVLMGGIPGALILSRLPTSLSISPWTIVLAAVLFVLGFALYGTIMAGIGSLGSSWRESQQVAGIGVMFAVIPLMLIVAILQSPNGVLARGLSWFPLTAPITLMLRTTAGTVPWWDIALSLGLLVGAIWLAQAVSAKIFRLGLLLYGKVPTFSEVWRWLRTA